MSRSPLAYLSDIVEACDALAVTLEGVDLAAYESTRTLRSAVEREFTIIGEAVNSVHAAPDLRRDCAVLIDELRRAAT
ncbi:MAG: hypothetical protein Q8K89_13635 [Actinomycetota bacterium]|nr:hypothetical protein [Actinomycetota bacterium]